MERKKIKIKFLGFWKSFREENNFIIRTLEKKFEVELSEDPEYVFYSVFNDDFIKYDCVRIFITGENIAPDFQMCDYAVGFERIDFEDRYLRCPFYFFVEEYQEDVQAALKKHEVSQKSLAEKKEFCSFVYSNRGADAMREKIFYALNGYKKVNAGGSVLNSYQGRRVENKRSFEQEHKFSIACENSRHNGYITEKILQSFAANTVPIYWGAADVGKDFNEKAFINVGSFSTLDELVSYIKEVDQDDELYLKYLAEPAFNAETVPEKYIEELEQFLLHIMEQPHDEAYRRNRQLIGKDYERRYWVYKRAYGFLCRLKKILGKRLTEYIEGYKYE